MMQTPALPVLPFVPEEDPEFPLPSAEQMEEALRAHPREFVAYLTERQEKIARRKADPLRHGYVPKIWDVCDDLLCRGKRVVLIDPSDNVPREIIGGSELYMSGGNRASKTQYCAYKIVRVLVDKPRARTWCFHTTGPSSIAMQQPRVYEYLPPEWKACRRHPVADIKYSQKNGFAGITPTFVAPNASQNWFKNYAQGLDTIEGEELDAAWFDELVTTPFIDAVRLRLATRMGLLLISFTPVEGYSATVKDLVANARDVLRVPAKLLPLIGEDGQPSGRYETVPRVQQAAYEDLKIVYFHIFDNPFGNPPEVVKKARAKGREGILMRCYGVPTKTVGVQFPTFSKEVHVITREHFTRFCKKGTSKHLVDPCSGRNPAMIWMRALEDEQTLVVYREWPTPGGYIQGVGDPGPWAEPDGNKHDGKKGPAQRPWGFGLIRWIEEILRAEGWREPEIKEALEAGDCSRLPRGTRDQGRGTRADTGAGAPREIEEIFQRDMDSRFGNAPTLARGETKTLIESMAELGMIFEPTPGEHQQEGIDQINDLLYYNRERPIGPDNKPRLLILEDCLNVIWALENWTGLDGQHGACKDWIDLLRYGALAPPVYFGEDAFRVRGGGSY